MQSNISLEELARRVMPVIAKHSVENVALIGALPGSILDEQNEVNLLVNLDGLSLQPNLEQLRWDLDAAIGYKVKIFTLESIRHSPYAKQVIREAVMLVPPRS